MSTKPPLVSRWGGRPPAHKPIILNPANATSDLVLQSEVIVQGFLSLQQHQYIYRLENGFFAGGLNSAMNIKWNGIPIEFEGARPGQSVQSRQSFFSPQVLKTTANAEVVAGATPVSARRVLSERADAYTPWTDAIKTPVIEGLKALVKSGTPVAVAASLSAASGETLFISSELKWADDMFVYGIRFKNEGLEPLRVTLERVRFDYQVDLYLEPGEEASYEMSSEEPPEETEALVLVPGVCRFPIQVLASQKMIERMTEEVGATTE